MRTEIDTHTHTLVSGHAYNTIREMAQMAAQKKLRALALTEHAPEMPGSTNLYYFQNLKIVPRELYGVRLLFGAELNIMDEDGTLDLPADTIRGLDIAIASLHTLCYRGAADQDAVMNAYRQVMEREEIDIIGHPDDGRFPADYEQLAKWAKETGTLLEVNNASLRPGGFRQNTRENAVRMLQCCKKHGTMVTLGTDAHVDVAIADYAYAEEVLKEADFPQELIANVTLEKFLGCLRRNR